MVKTGARTLGVLDRLFDHIAVKHPKSGKHLAKDHGEDFVTSSCRRKITGVKSGAWA